MHYYGSYSPIAHFKATLDIHLNLDFPREQDILSHFKVLELSTIDNNVLLVPQYRLAYKGLEKKAQAKAEKVGRLEVLLEQVQKNDEVVLHTIDDAQIKE